MKEMRRSSLLDGGRRAGRGEVEVKRQRARERGAGERR